MAEQRVQRRLTAFLAADVVGYSRLMGDDAAGPRTRFNAHLDNLIEPAIANRKGRIVKTTGDGILVEFSSVVDAVECAGEIQKGMTERNADEPDGRRMEFRIGVNLGNVIIEGDDIHGDGVNVAARLEALADPGGICVSGDVYRQARRKVEFGFEDLGEQKVKNIVEPVRAYRVLFEGQVDQQIASVSKPKQRRQWGAVSAAVILLVGAGAIWNFYIQLTGSKTTADTRNLSIVVLPFDNLSGDPKQEYFADAITEDLITDLSRIQGAFVIARSTSFTYKGKRVNAKDVAETLNVRYLLEGSVRRSGKQVRVNAQLIDGKSGAHIWSEKFDRDLKDVIALQSDITGHIASVLRAELLEAESRRPKPANLEAWDYAVRGTAITHRVGLRANGYLEAKQQFEKAIELDSDLAMAWEGLSFIHFSAATREIPGISVPNSVDLALEAAQKAVSLDPKSSNAYKVLGMAFYWKGQGKNALAACQKALDLNRNNDLAIICISRAAFILGRLEESIRLVKKALVLNPRFRVGLKNFYIGNALLYIGKYQESVETLKMAAANFPKHASIKLYLMSALAMAGRKDEARVVLAAYTKLARGKRNTIEKLHADREHIVPNFKRLAKALRKLGFPE